MNILLLTDGITPFVIGGMQKHSCNLAKQLALQGHRVTLFHCVTGKNKLPEREDMLSLFGAEAMKNIESICLRFPAPSWYPGHYLKESYIYSSMLFKRIESRLNEFDFIYAKGFTAWNFLEQKKRGKHMPPVGVKFHGYEMFQPPVGLRMRLENMMLSSPVKWNNVHANFFVGTATAAQYADLAEKYVADQEYEPGTVLEFGGEFEVTLAEDGTNRLAGIVSTNPAYLMNSECSGTYVVAIALQGRAPCKVRGKISKGDMLTSAGDGYARKATNPQIGTIIGKALADFDGTSGVIEVAVGRV
jgi:glycosyltransferase involved in cell wall biosynthesis